MAPKSDRSADRRWISETREAQQQAMAKRAVRARADANRPIPHAMEGFGIQFRIFAGIIVAVVVAGLVIYYWKGMGG